MKKDSFHRLFVTLLSVAILLLTIPQAYRYFSYESFSIGHKNEAYIVTLEDNTWMEIGSAYTYFYDHADTVETLFSADKEVVLLTKGIDYGTLNKVYTEEVKEKNKQQVTELKRNRVEIKVNIESLLPSDIAAETATVAHRINFSKQVSYNADSSTIITDGCSVRFNKGDTVEHLFNSEFNFLEVRKPIGETNLINIDIDMVIDCK